MVPFRIGVASLGVADTKVVKSSQNEPPVTASLHPACHLARVLHGMQAHQPITVTGLNSWGIIQVLSGLICAIEPDPDPNRPDGYPFRVVIAPRGRASLRLVDSDYG